MRVPTPQPVNNIFGRQKAARTDFQLVKLEKIYKTIYNKFATNIFQRFKKKTIALSLIKNSYFPIFAFIRAKCKKYSIPIRRIENNELKKIMLLILTHGSSLDGCNNML